jgi:unsaturated rhamnogalacturonyl hydrolase
MGRVVLRWGRWVRGTAGLAVSLAAAGVAQAPIQPAAPPTQQTTAQQASVRPGADPVLARALAQWPAGRVDTVEHPGQWSYQEGVLLDGIAAEWRVTGDGELLRYIQAAIDRSVDADGMIHFDEGAPFPAGLHALDDIELGRSVLLLARVLGQPRYRTAAKFLHDQMLQQPRDANGGYWHKQIYPHQMWLDGAYMAEPFMESYARAFDRPAEMDAVASQLLLMEEKLRERPGGLLRHGYDSSLQMDWANKTTGQSASVWGRGMGWYAMAAVDVLEQMPASDPQRAALEAVARRVLQAVVRTQDADSGLWWQVLDRPGQKGNYLEASASCMFVYALAKGVRLGVLPLALEPNVTRGWEGIQRHFVRPDGTLSGTSYNVGLGGAHHTDGSYDYYVSVQPVDNDARGVGAYLLALSEITQRRRAGDLLRRARGKTVLVDGWFNPPRQTSAEGNDGLSHSRWTDDAEGGYSAWAHLFQQYGMSTDVLDHAPRAEDLKGVEIYVIASPATPAMAADAHPMDRQSAEAIEAWVKAGGTLVVLQSGTQPASQTHLDLLTERFGLRVNPAPVSQEAGSDAVTLVNIPAGTGGIFRRAHRAAMPEPCTLTVAAPARAVLSRNSDVLMAVSRAGRGVVFASAAPWTGNGFLDGRRPVPGEDNFAAAQELTHWLISEAMAH